MRSNETTFILPARGHIVVHDGHNGVPQHCRDVAVLLVDAPPARDEDRLAGVVGDGVRSRDDGRKAHGIYWMWWCD